MLETILEKIRPVEDTDRGKLLTVSYSKLSLFENCAYRYKLKYIDGNYANSKTLALELGTILHKGLEIKGRNKIEGQDVDYDYIKTSVVEGCEEKNDKSTAFLPGTNDIKKRYMEDWMTKDENTGFNYNDKMEVYLNSVIQSRMENPEWNVFAVEDHFEFVYDNRCIVHGFIDRLDQNEDGEIKVIDYKSSKRVFRDADIKTPLQMVIYDIACVFKYGKLPMYHEYDFILLDKKQTTEDGVCSKGYLKRGLKKIDKLLSLIDEFEKSNIYKPSPTPLCYWCDFASKSHTPNADSRYGGSCVYHSLWKPDNKVFKVNKEWIPGEEVKPRRIF